MIQSIATVAGKLHVAVHGTGPAMVFWPSLFMDAGMYRWQLPHFAECYTTVAIDGPGHGGSGAAPKGLQVEACAQAVVQVLEALGVSPAVVVGSSWGGLVGVRLAAAHPHLVARLIVSGAPFDAPGRLERLGNMALATGVRLLGGTRPFQQAILAKLFSPDFLRNEPGAVNAAAHSFRTADRAAITPVIRSVLADRGSTLGALRLVRCPALVLAGERDTVVPPASALAHSKLFAKGSFEVLPGCGHLAALEDAAAFNHSVDRFLRQSADTQPPGGGSPGRNGKPKLPSLFGHAGGAVPL